MKTIEGDLIDLAKKGHFDVIVHGCNCFNTMGAGIAKNIKASFPSAYEADLMTEKSDKSKLGTITTANVLIAERKLTIVNAYTQYHWKGRGDKVHYEGLKSCFETIADQFHDCRIGYPMIGAGLAGGDWSRISKIIDNAL